MASVIWGVRNRTRPSDNRVEVTLCPSWASRTVTQQRRLTSLLGEDMQSRVHRVLDAFTLTVALLASTSCSSSGNGFGNNGAGGSNTTGGAASGSSAASGMGSGGTAVASAGQLGTAGSSAPSNTGGNLSSGGTPSGGPGGSLGSTAGASTGGAGGPSAAGGSGAVLPSAGCNKPAGLINGRTTIDVAGK